MIEMPSGYPIICIHGTYITKCKECFKGRVKEYNLKRRDYRKCWEKKNKRRRQKQHHDYYMKNRNKIIRRRRVYYQTHLEALERRRIKHKEYKKSPNGKIAEKKYYLKHYPQIKERAKINSRRTCLAQGDKVIRGLHKRDYPKDRRCELHQKIIKEPYRLVYHHWDNNDPNFGIWICNTCHKIIEMIDKMGAIELEQTIRKIIEKYNVIKHEI